jgi:2'-5' RNA ligase
MDKPLSKPEAEVSVRTFLAVELPRDQQEALGRIERHFEAQRSIVKLVAPQLLHLTLRFLGPVPHARLNEVEDAAAQAAGTVPSFSLELTELGAFPNERAPRVIWAGLASNAGLDTLRRLFVETETALESRGFGREERGFSPHITLARARDGISSSQRRSLGETLAGVKGSTSVSGCFPVRELVVMRSDLSPAGPRYTPLARAALAGGE